MFKKGFSNILDIDCLCQEAAYLNRVGITGVIDATVPKSKMLTHFVGHFLSCLFFTDWHFSRSFTIQRRLF